MKNKYQNWQKNFAKRQRREKTAWRILFALACLFSFALGDMLADAFVLFS
jgi:hypothetical protein